MNETTQTFLMLITSQLIQILVPILVTFLIGLIAHKIGAGRLAEVQAVVRFVVNAAEQSGLVDEITKTGTYKKAWAISEVQRLLDERGLKGISVATLSTMIEAEVFDTINRYRAGTLEVLEGEPISFSLSAVADAPCPNSDCPYHDPENLDLDDLR